MSRLGCYLAAAFGAATMVGCGGQSTGPANAPPQAQAPAETASDAQANAANTASAEPILPADAAPQAVVTKFLESLKAGDERVAAGLLTDRARDETRRAEMAVQPPGNESARFQVREVEYVTSEPKDGVYVNSVWTEKLDEDVITYQIKWLLKQQTEGWRVAGMVTSLDEAETLFLNFEDPADMNRKLEALGAEESPEEPVTQQPAGEPAERQAQNPAAGEAPKQ